MYTCSSVRVLAIAAFVVTLCAASLVAPNKDCVMDAEGKLNGRFVAPEPVLDITERQGSPCARGDYKCWCEKSIVYNNAIRRERGLGGAKVGTISMCDNAYSHSRKLRGSFRHQEMSHVTSEIKCGIFASAENIAWFTGETSNPAEKCFRFWKNYPKHLANIVGKYDVTVTGIYQNGDRTYCTQTFGKLGLGQGKMSGPSCAQV